MIIECDAIMREKWDNICTTTYPGLMSDEYG
jgi:hypothetical protein